MDLGNFFLFGPVPTSAMQGNYSWGLVTLSYVIASLASFVALDITERIRTSIETIGSKMPWLIGGAFAMGMGIWTMHFIGMLAFILPMPMNYEPVLTGLSMVIAIIASGFAFFLIKSDTVKLVPLMLGGVLLGLGIVSMHYTGMAAMIGVHIYYIPSIFFLSILIAIVASEAALWLMIQSSQTTKSYHALIKAISALVMGFAICGMHYTGMAAAIFVPAMGEFSSEIQEHFLNVNALSFYIATTTIIIMLIALAASRFWMNTLQIRNKKLIETEAILEQKSLELQNLNQHLVYLAESSIEKEERTRAILTAAADGIIVIDEKGVIEICNRAASEIFGYPIEEMLGKNITSFIGLINEKDHTFQPISPFTFIQKRDTLIEFIGLSKDKKIIPLELTISTSAIKNNKVYIIVFRNIAERKLAEQEMAALNYQLVSTAHLAGMAEVATSVLHNVGNVLTSINVSAQILLQRDIGFKVHGLSELAKLLKHHKNELDDFINKDPVGKILPDYLMEFTSYWEKEWAFIYNELESLNAKVQHVKSIIAMQQSLSVSTNMIEKVQLNKLIDDALTINFEMVEKHGINVEKDYGQLPLLNLDKVKIMQALINLIKNAMEALGESNKEEKRLILRTKMTDTNHVQVEVTDNGIGIKPEDLTKIFTYGFTTKKKGHGFGLHSTALSLQAMGGSLKVYSPGPNEGATFVLIFPKA